MLTSCGLHNYLTRFARRNLKTNESCGFCSLDQLGYLRWQRRYVDFLRRVFITNKFKQVASPSHPVLIKHSSKPQQEATPSRSPWPDICQSFLLLYIISETGMAA